MLTALQTLEIEIGCGKARFLIDRARTYPDARFLGVERVAKWARVARRRAESRGLANLQILHMDAREFIEHDVGPESVTNFHIYFPDPWPKRRHRKRRLLSPDFLALLNRRLVPGGTLEYATDFENYFDQVKELAHAQPFLWSRIQTRTGDPFVQAAQKTNYELKYIAAGRPIYYLELVK